jgi:hypothetical protein
MATDPRTGFQTTPSRPDDLPRRRDEPIPPMDRPANDELSMAEDVEERKAMFWLPIAIAFVLMLAIGFYFYGPYLAPLG